VILAGLPSNLLAAAAGPVQVGRGDPLLVVDSSDLDAYRWMEKYVEGGSIVLASPATGNRLPAYADVRVLYGHPFETPNADLARANVEAAFSGSMPLGEALTWLEKNRVQFVFYGPLERSLGSPPWLAELAEIYRRDKTVIYRVDAP